MRLAGDSRIYFFVAWVAWLVSGYCLLYVEYELRRTQFLQPYAVEAWIGMVLPIGVFALADWLVIRSYERVWFGFQRQSLGPVVLERESVDRLRADLRRSILLRWAAPPASRSMRAQLLTAALWLPALCAPEGTPWAARYREWIVDTVTVIAVCTAIVLLVSSGGLDIVWTTRAALALLAVGLLVIGFSLVRLAARRQAILDYFSAWRGSEAA